MATSYGNTGAYQKAEPMYLEAPSVQKAALGEAHPGYAGSLYNLALLYIVL